MNTGTPTELALIAGRGSYPLALADSARKQGVRRLFVVAFKGETDPAIESLADEVQWVRLGQLDETLRVLGDSRIPQAVMAGQITPTSLFRMRPDPRMLRLLAGLREKNAHTLFGTVAAELKAQGIELLPAFRFMESSMPAPGPLARTPPSERQAADIGIAVRIAKHTSGLDIGQTVVVKDGAILAVEAFEGTDETILRGGRLGGPGVVVVKVAKQDHDMRFDIPVIGMRTMKALKKVRGAALAVEARRTIMLDQQEFIRTANRIGLAVVAVEVDR